MSLKIICFISVFGLTLAFAKDEFLESRKIAGSLIKVQSLGSSYKGKYIAVEEYGYRSNNVPYARIRVIDVWKDKEMLEVEVKPENSNYSLSQIRERNRREARKKVKKYKINF